MQPVNSPGTSLPGDRNIDTTPLKTGGTAREDAPLTPAQRTSLERLITKIMSLSSLKSAEIWAGMRHDIGLKSGAEILSGHFPAAEQALQSRLTSVQNTLGTRQLLQQLTELLPQGNNRQAVSDFIRQQFGHTVLSSLSGSQLQQVVTLLQNGQLPQPSASLPPGTFPPSAQPSPTEPQPGALPQTSAPLDRRLLPAEQNSLNQLITRLTTLTGESPAKVLLALMDVQGLKPNDAIPAKNFPLLSQLLQTQVAMMQNHTSPTLAALQPALKQPMDAQEQQMVQDYAQSRFNAGMQTPLTPVQIADVVTFLYSKRLQQLQEKETATAGSASAPMPIYGPFISALPPELRPLFSRPRGVLILCAVCVIVLLWILI